MTIYFTMEYVPTRYVANESQIRNRHAVWNFKDGDCSESIINALASRVNMIAGSRKSDFIVCFVPASTREKTRIRYAGVASRLQALTGVQCSLDAIGRESDGLPGHVVGKSANPAADFTFSSDCFRGRDVILIDDVVTRGNTMTGTAARLLGGGARSVTGLAVAKTVHPSAAASPVRYGAF